MMQRVNCVSNEQGAWCRDARIKRSLFGIGARCCLVFEGKPCEYQQEHLRPAAPPFPLMAERRNGG
jgi:hypothetical protein